MCILKHIKQSQSHAHAYTVASSGFTLANSVSRRRRYRVIESLHIQRYRYRRPQRTFKRSVAMLPVLCVGRHFVSASLSGNLQKCQKCQNCAALLFHLLYANSTFEPKTNESRQVYISRGKVSCELFLVSYASIDL